jgi:5-methylcytosine-specific restriction enzyme subunit McrC
MTGNAVQVFEYGYVCSCQHTTIPSDVVAVSKHAYQYLRKVSLSDSTESKSLRLKSVGSIEAIQFLNYVGVLVTPDGSQIEVLPKIAKHDTSENLIVESRFALLNMLKSLGEFRHIQTDAAELMQQKMPLLEIFIGQFLSSVNRLVKKGIKRDYQPQNDNLLFLKGKLKSSEQLKRNLVQKQRFAVDYDEYLPDILTNQLIKTAIQKVLNITRSPKHQKLARELDFVLFDVALLNLKLLDKLDIKINRGMEHYTSPVAWSKIILSGMSPLSMQGNANAFSLLFPLEAVFESYVEQVLRKTLPRHLRLKGQSKKHHLVTYQNSKMFNLKPDITVSDDDRIILVLDTKWKLIDASKANGTDKFMLSQQDFYQMFAYGHKYLDGVGELVLVFPVNERFTQPLPSPFEFSPQLRLWVVPFDIHYLTQDTKRFKMTDKLKQMLIPISIALKRQD